MQGLRREEVASLAGVSVDYYTRLERGNLNGVSESVLDSVARALQLDDAERTHLFDLARVANSSPRSLGRVTTSQRVRPTIQRMLDAMVDVPSWVHNGRMDFLAANKLGYALYSEMFTEVTRPVNSLRFTFLNPRARAFFDDWNDIAHALVAILRAEASQAPYDKGFSDLVGELSTRSDEFARMWASHDVLSHRNGAKVLHHPVVGELALTYETMLLPADPGLRFITYTAEPGSATEDSLRMLSSWAATLDRESSSERLTDRA